MSAIKFGTDGWRGIIAQDFTFENLRRAALAAASYFKNHPNAANGVCVGYDTRFLSAQFARCVAEIFSSQGLKVFLADTLTPTPAVSLFVRDKRLAGGIVITASHNPPHYNGFKVKAEYGGSAHPETIAVIERYLSSIADIEKVKANPTLIALAPVRRYYRDYLANELNLTAIAQSGWRIAHNAMFGAGQGLVAELLPKGCVVEYHCAINPTFEGINPEPIPSYIEDFVPFYKQSGCEVAILTDGDADRIGMLDEHGRFVDSHKIFSLLLKYLVEEQGKRGEVARTYALTEVINKICAKHALTVHNLPIGFKHVGKLMTTRDILIGGEESGGIGITAHLPERDGIYIGLLVTEVMARRKKKLSELVEELYQEYGYFTYERIDARLSESQKAELMHKVAQGSFREIEGMRVTGFENLDGYKYFFEGGWLLIRASGTEPIVRLYSEADSEEKVARALAFAQSLAGLTAEKV